MADFSPATDAWDSRFWVFRAAAFVTGAVAAGTAFGVADTRARVCARDRARVQCEQTKVCPTHLKLLGRQPVCQRPFWLSFSRFCLAGC